MYRVLAALVAFVCLLLPVAAQECQTFDSGVTAAAEYSAASDDRVSVVLLTAEETLAVWRLILKRSDPPMVDGERLGVFIMQSTPDVAMVAGFDGNGCLIGTGNMAFGQVLDAMVAAGVKSEFIIIEPAVRGGGA